MITKNDYDYDYSQRKLIMITIMITNPWLRLWLWLLHAVMKQFLNNLKKSCNHLSAVTMFIQLILNK